MPRFVAFLRALNVGGHGVVKMEALKKHFTAMGFSDVETFIASGNVVFSSKGVKGLDGKIAAALERALGYRGRDVRSDGRRGRGGRRARPVRGERGRRLPDVPRRIPVEGARRGEPSRG